MLEINKQEQEHRKRTEIISQVALSSVVFLEKEMLRLGLGKQDLGAAKNLVYHHLGAWQFWRIDFTPQELVFDLARKDQSAPGE